MMVVNAKRGVLSWSRRTAARLPERPLRPISGERVQISVNLGPIGGLVPGADRFLQCISNPQ